MGDFPMPEAALPTKNLAEVIKTNADLSKAAQEARVVPKEEQRQAAEKLYTTQDLENFWISILNEEPFTEVGEVKGVNYSLRTITDKEKLLIENYLDHSEIKTTLAYEAMEARCHLAFCLVQFAKYKQDVTAPLEKKLEQLGKLPITSYEICLRLAGRFNSKVIQLLESVVKDDFFGQKSR